MSVVEKKEILLVATRNKKKFQEIKSILKDMPYSVKSLYDFVIPAEITEDGNSYYENARKKAIEYSKMLDCLVLGEDSGLEVEYLNNEPGILSSRYSGPEATDRKNNNKVLRQLKKVDPSKRTAVYRCVVVLAYKQKEIASAEGICKGRIAMKAQGKAGFGYDPIFIPENYNKPFGQLGIRIKNKISHRAKALAKIKKVLLEFLSKKNKVTT